VSGVFSHDSQLSRAKSYLIFILSFTAISNIVVCTNPPSSHPPLTSRTAIHRVDIILTNKADNRRKVILLYRILIYVFRIYDLWAEADGAEIYMYIIWLQTAGRHKCYGLTSK
jgi:hypothetical protein